MKKKVLLVLSSLAVCIPSAVVLIKKGNKVEKVEAYEYITPGKLEKNINLNDTDSSVIRSYYADANGYNGEALLAHLKDILKNGQKYFSYESNAAIWQLYEIIDRDWVKSPASAISGYNSVTNTISSYSYGTNTENIFIHALYVNRTAVNYTKANDRSLAWGINQEHVWAKSHGYEDSGQGGARGDPMNLVAGNARVNQQEHNNNYYGYVNMNKSHSSPTDVEPVAYAHLAGNYYGYSRTFPTSNSKIIFEPQDSDKGDIARSVFYMAARYNFLSGSDDDGINSNNPNLSLTDNLLEYKSKGYQSTEDTYGYMGIMRDLLEWNRLDPPDQFEIHRNNLLYENYTKNRNPFIDFPEWADLIWGSNPEEKVTNVSSDVISGHEKLVTSRDEYNLESSKSLYIGATTEDSSSITWSIADSTIATLETASSDSFGFIKLNGVKEGETTVTATATVGGSPYVKTMKVKVTQGSPLSKITIKNATQKTFLVGDEFVKPVVSATYENGNQEDVSDIAVCTGYDMSKVGTQTVTVKVTKGEITKQETYQITVKDPSSPDDPSDEKGGLDKTTMIIIIAVAAGVIVITVLIILFASKSTKKKAGKIAKKAIKKTAKQAMKKK